MIDSPKSFLNAMTERRHDEAADFLTGMSDDARNSFLEDLAVRLVQANRNAQVLPDLLLADRLVNPRLFEFLLLELLIPCYHKLVALDRWDEALDFESNLYSKFIKQNEDESFYEQVFGLLYQPYSRSSGRFSVPDRDSNRQITEKSGPGHPAGNRKKLLFLLQNFNQLAHFEVLLTHLRNSGEATRFCVAALYEESNSQGRQLIESTGATVMPLGQNISVSERYRHLIRECSTLEISAIVFVSLPLHSGFIRAISGVIDLVWWSMKFPLGSLHHFDRLVCYRSLEPETRRFNGVPWLCAPFSTEGLKKSTSMEAREIGGRILLGVLAREEKFASSDLPELLNSALRETDNTIVHWTGRQFRQDIESRLSKDLGLQKFSRTEFAGWVDPGRFLNSIDVLIDTPNLGGLVAYWAMSLDKVVVSASSRGSIAALGSLAILKKHFHLIDDQQQLERYFSSTPSRPFFLTRSDLVPACLLRLSRMPDLIPFIGTLFGNFFRANLNRFAESASITNALLCGEQSIIRKTNPSPPTMEKIKINRSRLSQLVWEQIYENSVPYHHTMQSRLFEAAIELEKLRASASYNTGSITTSAIWSLYAATMFFRPRRVAEVGTFIGKSTLAVATALDVAWPGEGRVYTCDFSNRIDLNLNVGCEVVQYPMQSSTDMFTDLAGREEKIDVLLLDGRLQPADFPLLSHLLHGESVILLDDFEGVEKGSINAMQLMNSLKDTHLLAYPPSRELLGRHGHHDSCTLAMIIPKSLVVHSNQ